MKPNTASTQPRTFLVLLAGLLGMAACEMDEDPFVEERAACIEQYARHLGYGIASEDSVTGRYSPESARLPTIEQLCASDGDPCPAEDFMSHEAARCIAAVHGIDPGLTPWRVYLTHARHRPVWVVETTTRWVDDPPTPEFADDDCEARGDFFDFDAITGEPIELEGQWLARSNRACMLVRDNL